MNIFKFLFINFYAFLLLLVSVVIFVIPNNIFLIVIKTGLGLFALFGTVTILSMWKRKLRMIDVLMKRNSDGFNEESFQPYMETFCSQLVVLYVLKKIGHLDKFKGLFSTFWKNL